MGILKSIWENIYGLLVDDGQLAAGALIIFFGSGAIAEWAPDEALREASGYLLLGLICALVLTNLYIAGRNAARKRQLD